MRKLEEPPSCTGNDRYMKPSEKGSRVLFVLCCAHTTVSAPRSNANAAAGTAESRHTGHDIARLRETYLLRERNVRTTMIRY